MFSFKHQAFRCSCMKDMIHGNVDYHRERFFSGVVTKNYRNQGQRPRNWEKGTWSQHFGKMILSIMKLQYSYSEKI